MDWAFSLGRPPMALSGHFEAPGDVAEFLAHLLYDERDAFSAIIAGRISAISIECGYHCDLPGGGGGGHARAKFSFRESCCSIPVALEPEFGFNFVEG